MSEPLVAITSRPSMSSAADSRVRTSVRPASGKALTAHGLVFGETSAVSWASYDRATSSWRTSQRCLTGEWAELSETWPTSGMTRSGRLYPRAPWVPHTHASACSFWPTPAGQRGIECGGVKWNEVSEAQRHIHQWSSESMPARVADGIPHRMDRVHALQVAEWIFRRIEEAEAAGAVDPVGEQVTSRPRARKETTIV